MNIHIILASFSIFQSSLFGERRRLNQNIRIETCVFSNLTTHISSHISGAFEFSPRGVFHVFLSFFLAILSRSSFDHHLRCVGWLNLNLAKGKNIRDGPLKLFTRS